MSKINLKKALQFQEELKLNLTTFKAKLNGLNRVVYTETEDVEKKHDKMQKEFAEYLEKYLSYTNVFYSLRQKVSIANNSKNVDNLMTSLAKAASLQEYYNNIATFGVADDMISIKGALKSMKEQTSQYSQRQVIATTSHLLSGEQIKEYQKLTIDNKREVQSLKDQLLAINVTTFVELSAEEEKALQELGLI